MNEVAENVMPPVDGILGGRLCVGGGTCARGQRGACRELPALSEEVGWAGSPVGGAVSPCSRQDALLSQAGVQVVYAPSGWPSSWQRTGSPAGALSLGGWTCPEVYECFRQQADQQLLEHTKGTLGAQTADLEHPTLGGGVFAVTPAPRLSPGLHGASSVWKPVRDCRA